MTSAWPSSTTSKFIPCRTFLMNKLSSCASRFRAETNGDPLQKYIHHFAGTKGKAQPATAAHVETIGR
jgi:hypothetical protein